MQAVRQDLFVVGSEKIESFSVHYKGARLCRRHEIADAAIFT
jgi:hypothetical protein